MGDMLRDLYDKAKELERAHEEALCAGNREAAERVDLDYKEYVTEPLRAAGPAAERLFREYEAARDKGDDVLVLEEPVRDYDVPGLVESMRAAGVDGFVYAAQTTSAAEISYLFIQNGCVLEGVDRVNRGLTRYGVRKYEYGYRFGVEA